MTPSEQSPTTPPRKRRNLLITAAVVAALLAGGFVVWRATAGGTVSLHGSVTVSDEDSLTFTRQVCEGQGGYADMRAGATVTVTDGDGNVVALGELAAGTARGYGVCVWEFRIDGIPTGRRFYGVEVSRRGMLRVSESELGDPLTLTLGS